MEAIDVCLSPASVDGDRTHTEGVFMNKLSALFVSAILVSGVSGCASLLQLNGGKGGEKPFTEEQRAAIHRLAGDDGMALIDSARAKVKDLRKDADLKSCYTNYIDALDYADKGDEKRTRRDLGDCKKYCSKASANESYLPEANEFLTRCETSLNPMANAHHSKVLEEALSAFENATAPAEIAGKARTAKRALETAKKDLSSEDFKEYALRFNAAFDRHEAAIQKFEAFQERSDVRANLLDQEELERQIKDLREIQSASSSPGLDRDLAKRRTAREERLKLLKEHYVKLMREAGLLLDSPAAN